MPKTVIIDCDPGIDDALALLLAFSSPALDVRAVTVVGGNQELSVTLENAIGLLTFAGLKAPVAAGAPGPMLRPLVTAPEVHGSSGLGGKHLPMNFEPSPLSAVELMRRVTEESPEPVVLIATAPLTNVAAFLTAYPALKHKIEYISIMGGACFGGNQSPAAEFNIYVDPEAAAAVFRSGVPIVMHGLDVTTRAFLSVPEIEEIRGIGKKVSALTADILDFYMEFQRSVGFSVANMHDLCAVAYVFDPSLFTGRDCHVEIETKGELTRGCTVVDSNGATGLPKNAKVIFDVDRAKFVELFISAVRGYK